MIPARTPLRRLPGLRLPRRGAAAVEFALVASAFFMLLFGVIELARLMYLWNAAAEATRLGARTAAVCDLNAAAVKARVRALMPGLTDADIDLSYSPAGCGAASCSFVTVRLVTAQPIQTAIPFLPLSVNLPAFSTTLSRESLASTVNGTTNPVCQ